MVKISDHISPTFDENNLMIVDAMNLAFRWKHQGITKFTDDYIRTVRSLAKSYKANKIVIAADQGGSRYRKEIFPDYKANRKDVYKDDTPEEKELTRKFFDEYERVLEECDKQFTVLRFQGVEADDIAAYLVSRRDKLGFDDIWLISSDRDWDLLIDEHTHRFSTVTRKEQTLYTWDNAVSPEYYLSYKCLVGDKGDNIPGVPGVGPVRAAAIIEQFGSVLDIADSIPISGRYKYIQALNEFGADALRTNVELMDLVTYCEEAIGKQNVLEIDTVMEN